jgi:hypothetical protein
MAADFTIAQVHSIRMEERLTYNSLFVSVAAPETVLLIRAESQPLRILLRARLGLNQEGETGQPGGCAAMKTVKNVDLTALIPNTLGGIELDAILHHRRIFIHQLVVRLSPALDEDQLFWLDQYLRGHRRFLS